MHITYGTQKLADIYDDIKNGSLTVPSFQREFDWSSSDIANLYESIVHRQEPFGSIVIWKDSDNSKAIPMTNKIFTQLSENKVSDTQKNYLIDGQQRVTSFLMSYIQEHVKNAKHINKITKVYYDVENKKFLTRAKDPKGIYISTNIFHKTNEEEFIYALEDIFKQRNIELTRKHERNATSTYKNFLNIDVGTIKISSNDLNEVIDVFTLINTKGKRLSPFNIVHASYTKNDKEFNITNEFKKINKKLEEKYENWNIPNTTLLMVYYSVTKGTISNKRIMEMASESNKTDRDFIKNDLSTLIIQTVAELKELGFLTFDFLPSDKFLYLTAKIVHDNGCKTLGGKASKIISQWIKLSVINQRYSSGAEGAKENGFSDDWKTLSNLVKEEKMPIENMKIIKWMREEKFEFEIVKEISYKATSLEYKYIMTMMVKNIKSIKTHKLVKKTKNKLRDLNLHHIFPSGNPTFKNYDYINSIFNITPLEMGDNLDISNEPPHLYMDDYVVSGEYDEFYLNDNLKDFDKFIDARGKQIIKMLNK